MSKVADIAVLNSEFDGLTLAEVATAVGDKPVRVRAKTWQSGWNRNNIDMTAIAGSMAATSAGKPLLYHHDVRMEEGVIEAGALAVEDDGSIALMSDIAMDGAAAKASLARGVEPHFSVHPSPLEGGQLLCSDCGTDWVSSICFCPFFGASLSAQGPWELAEISRTPTPAVPGTGVVAALAAYGLGELTTGRLEVLMSTIPKGALPQAGGKPPAEDDAKAQLAAMAEQNAALKAANEAMLAANEALGNRLLAVEQARLADESGRVVTALMEAKRPKATRDALLALRARDPKLFDEVAAVFPEVPKGPRVPQAGPPGAAPRNGYEVRDRAQQLAAETKRSYEVCLAEVLQAIAQGGV